jgi:hypothetical protein
MTYVAIDGYLKTSGKLGFVITQTVFKTTGGSEGFRRFRLGDRDYFQILHVDDMSAIKPFEGAANRTSVMILQKGEKTEYPIPYTYWRKKKKGVGIPEDIPLKTITDEYVRTSQWQATPVNIDNLYSPWITGRQKALAAVRKVIGKSEYQGREGSNTGGLNGAFWVRSIAKRPDGSIVIANEADIGKKKVESRQAAIEPDLLYPLLRGQDVQKWHAEPSLHIVLMQNPETRVGWNEDWMKETLPKTYAYIKHFENQLLKRSGYAKYFNPDKDPFYSMYNVGQYTLSAYKVVWREQASFLTSAVVVSQNGKPVIPDHKLMLTPCSSEKEAYYLCACLSSSIALFTVKSYAIETSVSTHVMNYLAISEFNHSNKLHQELASLSKDAHRVAAEGERSKLEKIEKDIDEVVARMWGLSPEELKDIQDSLKDLAS